jgi:hypothetical protein
MLEFVKEKCVAAQFCGKLICDEMMDALMKETDEASCMGHRFQYLISY